jgi:hypothetical protein
MAQDISMRVPGETSPYPVVVTVVTAQYKATKYLCAGSHQQRRMAAHQASHTPVGRSRALSWARNQLDRCTHPQGNCMRR